MRVKNYYFFNTETAFVLRRWLKLRDGWNKKGINALKLLAQNGFDLGEFRKISCYAEKT
ncbi:Uncharacterised protein [uncultured archaeon]|nr:Uncharacterised protein [uncultured archaeon]